MGVFSVAVIGLIVFICILTVLKMQQSDDEQVRRRYCELSSHHSLQFHAYDGKGNLVHHCGCRYRVRYGKQARWCRVCADVNLERHARAEFVRERQRVYGTNN